MICIFTRATKYNSAIKAKGMNNMDESGEHCIMLREPQREASRISLFVSCRNLTTRENGGY